MTPGGKNKKELIQLCGQLRETVDQLQIGISGKRKRNRRSGAEKRSRKNQKRKAAVAASANALANVHTDNGTLTSSDADVSVHLIVPSPLKCATLVQKDVKETERVDKQIEVDDVATNESQNSGNGNKGTDQEKSGC